MIPYLPFIQLLEGIQPQLPKRQRPSTAVTCSCPTLSKKLSKICFPRSPFSRFITSSLFLLLCSQLRGPVLLKQVIGGSLDQQLNHLAAGKHHIGVIHCLQFCYKEFITLSVNLQSRKIQKQVPHEQSVMKMYYRRSPKCPSLAIQK